MISQPPTNDRRPRVLVLTSRFPYPVVGGDRLRIWQVCRALAVHCDLTLLSLCERPEELTAPVPDDGVFCTVERFLRPTWRSYLAAGLAIPTRTPLQVAYYRHSGFRRRVAQLARTHDGVLSHLIRTADATLGVPGPRFCELTDAISLNYERAAKARDGVRDLRGLAYAIERSRLRDYERRIVADMDASFLVSPIDAEFLAGADDPLADKLIVAPNGVDVSSLPFTSPRTGAELTFIGNLASLQNLDAALFAARDVLPLVRAKRPDASLRIVGRIDERRAEQLRALPGVTVTGEVDSIPDAVASSSIGIAPMRIAAGVQNKVLEYAALGLPAVITPMTLEGLDAVPGDQVLVADGAQGLADAIVRLLDDPDLAARMAANARTFVAQQYAWGVRLAPLVDAVLAALLNCRGVRAD